ncbi:MAG: MMPL family transporter, partial [Chthoniobacteraceae bacterium]
AEGRLKNVNSPAAFALSPERTRTNAARLAGIDFPAARNALTTAIQREGFSEDSFQTAFAFLDTLAAVAKGDLTVLDWQKKLPASSAWWFVIDRFLARTPNLGVAYVSPIEKIASVAGKEQFQKLLTVPGVEVHLSGWTYALQDLVPWAKSKLVVLTVTMLGLNVVLLLFLYRSFFPLFILILSLVLSAGALVASLKLLGISLNLFNILAFPLVLGVGVDYGIYVVIAMRAPDPLRELTTILKPVLLSGLTTAAGFGSLITANNPSLRGLGAVCAFGVGWCLFSTFLLIIPAYLWRGTR